MFNPSSPNSSSGVHEQKIQERWEGVNPDIRAIKNNARATTDQMTAQGHRTEDGLIDDFYVMGQGLEMGQFHQDPFYGCAKQTEIVDKKLRPFVSSGKLNSNWSVQTINYGVHEFDRVSSTRPTDPDIIIDPNTYTFKAVEKGEVYFGK